MIKIYIPSHICSVWKKYITKLYKNNANVEKKIPFLFIGHDDDCHTYKSFYNAKQEASGLTPTNIEIDPFVNATPGPSSVNTSVLENSPTFKKLLSEKRIFDSKISSIRRNW